MLIGCCLWRGRGNAWGRDADVGIDWSEGFRRSNRPSLAAAESTPARSVAGPFLHLRVLANVIVVQHYPVPEDARWNRAQARSTDP